MKGTEELDRRGQFQQGLVTQQQLTRAGFTRRKRRTLAEHGLLTPANHGVLRTFGTPPGWEQKVLAACLSAGPQAVASHRAAALLWDLIDAPAPVEITVPYRHRPLPVRTIRHRTRKPREIDRAVRHGIPVTTPARTLLDLGAVAPQLVPDAVERCLYQRLLSTAALWRILDEVGGRGRRGTRALRQALERRALGDAPPRSLLEPLLASIATAAGIQFEYQFPVKIEGHRYVLDFALPHVRLACEVDGLSAHGTREALDHDLDRQNRLVRHGWMILRYTATHLKRRRSAIRAEIVAAIAKRSAMHLL
jgi:very-short-patch-repair endonuclease